MGSKLGINGFGRIGRLLLRAAMHRKVPVGAINNPFVDADYLSYLFKFDSTHGRFPGRVCSVPPTCMQVDGGSIPLSYEPDPTKINWKDLGVEYVAECSGAFLTIEKAGKHIEGGAKKVIISAPSPDAPMFVCGVNLECYKPEMCIISNASCTTNGLAPLAKVVHEHFTICEGLMTTIHSVTATQKIVDGTSGKAWRDGRSGMANMIPASTGAAKAVGKVLPELDGKLTGMSIRVPTPNVSIVDLTIRTAKPTSIECIKTKVKEASEKELKGILQYIEHDLVSMDMNCSTYSSVFDSKASMGLNSKFFKLISWYDNEYGYANRLLDLILHVCETDKKAGKSGGKKDEKKPAKAAAAK